jgi:hypothetical protein
MAHAHAGGPRLGGTARLRVNSAQGPPHFGRKVRPFDREMRKRGSSKLLVDGHQRKTRSSELPEGPLQRKTRSSELLPAQNPPERTPGQFARSHFALETVRSRPFCAGGPEPTVRSRPFCAGGPEPTVRSKPFCADGPGASSSRPGFAPGRARCPHAGGRQPLRYPLKVSKSHFHAGGHPPKASKVRPLPPTPRWRTI